MVRLTQNSFLGGQLDYEMMGRQDFARYQKGASRLVNFNIMRRGGICKRQGFDRVLDLSVLGLGATQGSDGKWSVPKVRLIPFAHTKDKGYVLLVSSGRMWAVRSDQSAVPYNQEHEIGTPAQVFAVTNSSGGYALPYVGDEIDELDYQQCGDELFIAHQNHPPAKVTHSIENGADYFTYSTIGVRNSASGTPKISGCTLTRSAVQCYGATMTEKYVATAVFETGETVPCTEYYSTTVNNDGPTGDGTRKSWSGTTYYLPWTESQKIDIKVTPRARRDVKTGTLEYPKEIRLYKKAFNYYGLIATAAVKWKGYEDGTLSLHAMTVGGTSTQMIGHNGTLSVSDREYVGVNADRLDEDNVSFLYPGWEVESDTGRSGISLANGSTMTFKRSGGIGGANFTHNCQVKLCLGLSYISKKGTAYQAYGASTSGGEVNLVGTYGAQADAESALASMFDTSVVEVYAVRFIHVANKCGKIGIYINSASTASAHVLFSPRSADEAASIGVGRAWFVDAHVGQDASEFCIQNEDESDVDFYERARSEFVAWRAGISDQGGEVVVTDTSSTAHPYLRIVAADGSWEGSAFTPNDGSGPLVACAVLVRDANSAPSAITISDRNIVPDSSVTPLEPIDNSLFSGAGNYPASVSLTQQRLVWASSKNDPARIWLSQVGDFYTYNPHQIQVPDDPIDFVVPVTRFAKINHIVEMRKLLMFNSACEWMVDSASSVSGLTYETIQAYPQSYSGSNARLKPLVCNNSVVFCERSGQSVRRFAWDLTNDGFAGKDVSILSSSIFERNPIVDWTYQQFPYSTIWCALADGTAASFEYMEEQDILAWATHRYGDAKDGKYGKFRCFATTYSLSPALDMMYDQTAREHATHEAVFAVVENGYDDADGNWVPTGQWIERMRVRSAPKDSVYHSLCLDGLRVLNKTNHALPMDVGYTAPSTYSWMNLPQNKGLVYLEKAKADGSETTSGLKPITREQALERLLSDDAGVEIYEGWCFMSDYMSVFPVISRSVTGAGQMDIKDIGNVALRLMASSGGTVRAEGCPETEPIRYDDDPGAIKTPKFLGGGVVQFFDVDAANVKPVGINTRDGRFHVEQDLPWPFSVLMFELDVETEVSRG